MAPPSPRSPSGPPPKRPRCYKPSHAGRGGKTLDLAREKRQGLYREAGRLWEKFSLRFLAHNPECYVCGGPSRVTDHIEPHQGRREVFERLGNHLALCLVCHNVVTAKFDRRYRGDPYILTSKVKWMNETRARNELVAGRVFPRPKVVNYLSDT